MTTRRLGNLDRNDGGGVNGNGSSRRGRSASVASRTIIGMVVRSLRKNFDEKDTYSYKSKIET